MSHYSVITGRAVVLGLVLLTATSSEAGDPEGRGLVSPRTYAITKDGRKFEPTLVQLAQGPANVVRVRRGEVVLQAARVMRLADLKEGTSQLRRLAKGKKDPGAVSGFVAVFPTSLREQDSARRGVAGLRPGGWALLLGHRLPGEKGAFLLRSSMLDRGLASPIIPFASRDLDSIVRDAQVYARVMSFDRVSHRVSHRVSDELWRAVLRMSNPDVRYVCMRDVIAASYQRGLGSRDVTVRRSIADELVSSVASITSDSLRRRIRLQLLCLVARLDRDPLVCGTLAGEDLRWWIDLSCAEDVDVRVAAMGAAASDELAPIARRIALDMVVARITQSQAMSRAEVSCCEALLARVRKPKAGMAQHASALIAAIEGAVAVGDENGKARSSASPNQALRLLEHLARVAPDLAAAVRDASTRNKSALRSLFDGARKMRGEGEDDHAKRLQRIREEYGISRD